MRDSYGSDVMGERLAVDRLAGRSSTCWSPESAVTADANVEIHVVDANAAAPRPLRRVVELADWREIFEGPDPAAAFWDETSECLSQFADMFDIADKDAEEYVCRHCCMYCLSSRTSRWIERMLQPRRAPAPAHMHTYCRCAVGSAKIIGGVEPTDIRCCRAR